MALAQLSLEDQQRVREIIASLPGADPNEWPPDRVRKLPGDRPLYLLRVDDSLRAILGNGAGRQPEVLDIVRRETLETFARAGK